LISFLADLHALKWHEIHPDNRSMVSELREGARAEIARRIFLPWWKPTYTSDFIPGYGYLGQ